jgi:hypothetical protein
MARWQLTVSRFLQFLSSRKSGAVPAQLARSAACLDLFLSYRLISTALVLGSKAEIDTWSRNAHLLEQHLPGWTVRLYYNSSESSARDICVLRARRNVELVDAWGSTVPPEYWRYLPALEGGIHALVLASEAAELAMCELGALASWQGDGAKSVLVGRCPDWKGPAAASSCFVGLKGARLAGMQIAMGKAVESLFSEEIRKEVLKAMQ